LLISDPPFGNQSFESMRLLDPAPGQALPWERRSRPSSGSMAGGRMPCPRCRHENPAGQKFCGECGARLASACAGCGAANPAGQKFCGECGAPLAAPASPAKFASPASYTPSHLAERILTSKRALPGERKQITV